MEKTQIIGQDRSFGYRFAMLHRLHMALCRQKILDQGLKPSHLPFILCLVHEPAPVTQDYLSCFLAIDKGTTARALGQLEKKGVVTRRTNPENKRQNLVSATPRAHGAAEALSDVLDGTAHSFVKGFTGQEKTQVLDLMDRMLANARNAAHRN